MRRCRRAAASLFAGLVVGVGGSARAQTITLAVSNLKADSMPPAPNMTVSAFQSRPELGPYNVTLELSTEAGFQRPFYFNSAAGEQGTFTIDSLLPEATPIFFRARLIDRFGTTVAQTLQQHPVQHWVRLIEPAPQSLLVPVNTRTPRFVWSSPPITLPPGLWEFDLSVFSTATGQPVAVATDLSDTAFTFPDSLEANASYRWQVRARGHNSHGSGEVTTKSAGTFVISSTDRPTFTLFYQNFPNPFGRGQLQPFTCFWFDLARPSEVRLTIFDLRLRQVRRILPGATLRGVLPVGAYGRTPTSGCVDELKWDGRDDNGDFVPPGVYIAELRADGKSSTKKMLFKGP